MGYKQVLVGIVVAVIAVISSNIRWQYVFKHRTGRVLPYTLVEVEGTDHVPVVLLHGMWHSPQYFDNLQFMLQGSGFTSYAISLLPGERALYGGTQTELIRDLEKTFESIERLKDSQIILLGHSQGGLIVQSAMKYSRAIAGRTKGIVLLGTFPFELKPFLALLTQKKNMYQLIPYTYLSLTGKLYSKEYTKHIFLMDETDYEGDSSMKSYIERLMAAPSDGFITVSHFLTSGDVGVVSEKETLVLGAEHDIIYPPKMLESEFRKRFPNSVHVVAANQAHCFVDVGWEESMGGPLLEWIKKL